MSGGCMTILGVVGAALAFLLAGLPPETPPWVSLCLGAVNAALVAYIGKTHPGSKGTR